MAAFRSEATAAMLPQPQIEGILEILPVGFVELTARPQKQTIPLNGGWLPDWKSDSASFQLASSPRCLRMLKTR